MAHINLHDTVASVKASMKDVQYTTQGVCVHAFIVCSCAPRQMCGPVRVWVCTVLQTAINQETQGQQRKGMLKFLQVHMRKATRRKRSVDRHKRPNVDRHKRPNVDQKQPEQTARCVRAQNKSDEADNLPALEDLTDSSDSDDEQDAEVMGHKWGTNVGA